MCLGTGWCFTSLPTRELYSAHKETAEQNKRRRIDYKATLDEWCKENDKPAPSVKAIPQIGGM